VQYDVHGASERARWTLPMSCAEMELCCGETESLKRCCICAQTYCEKALTFVTLEDQSFLSLGVPESGCVCRLCWTPEMFEKNCAVKHEQPAANVDSIVASLN